MRHRRDDHTGGMHRGVAGQALEAAADLDDLADLRVLGDLGGEAVDGARRLRQRLGHVREQLGDPVHLRERQSEHPPDVAQARPSRPAFRR